MACKTIATIVEKSDLHCFVEICSRLLKFCNSHSLKEGICVHSSIIKLSLERDLYLNNNLLCLRAKCFGADNARHFFDEMPHKDVVSWTGILSAYVKNGKHDEALQLFDSMVISGQSPNEFTLSSVLRSCSALGEFSFGTRIQAYMIKQGFESNLMLATILVDLYSRYTNSEEGFRIFTEMDNADTVSWTIMISSFVENWKWSRALKLYPCMLNAGVLPNEFSFVKLLTASSFLGLKYGKLLHAHLIMWGVKLNLILKTALVDMYSRCQRIEDAVEVSNQTSESDVFLWTAIIFGFVQNLRVRDAMVAFHEMEMSGVLPNNFTYSSIISGCSSILSLELGEQIHSRVIMVGLEEDVSVGNALVDVYVKCSNTIEHALRVFRGIISPNVISWTSLIAGFAEHGFEQESFRSYQEMRTAGVQPNSFTLSSILGACSSVKSVSETMKFHGYIIKTNAGSDTVVGNALVDAYAGLGMVADAWGVISMMNFRDVITYTSLATRISHMGNHEMALKIITRMNNDDVKMDAFSLASFLSAAAGIAAMETGKQFHCYSVKSGLCIWTSVSNGLVDLYGKCGCIHELHRAFEEIIKPDAVSWNGLISGLASNGYISSALSAYEDMRLAGTKPDSVTFLLLLFACSHGRLVDLGLEHFQSMKEVHNVAPLLDHYVCLVDLLGRAGRLEEALGVIETMQFRPDALIYKTLLSACKMHGNIPLGEDMARRGLDLDPSDPAFYLLLAKIYDDSGRSDLGEKTRRLMRDNGLKANPGHSWMEIRNKGHIFVAGDKSHPHINEIREKIESLVSEFKNRGYLYQYNRDSSYHCEKLAVAFGLLNTPSKAPIRIIKNTSICRDCHHFIMLVTRLADREIIVRAGNRLHSFKKGECFCGGCQ